MQCAPALWRGRTGKKLVIVILNVKAISGGMIRLKDVVELFEIQTVYNEKDSNQEQEQKTEYDIEYKYISVKSIYRTGRKISGDEYYKRIDWKDGTAKYVEV